MHEVCSACYKPLADISLLWSKNVPDLIRPYSILLHCAGEGHTASLCPLLRRMNERQRGRRAQTSMEIKKEIQTTGEKKIIFS